MTDTWPGAALCILSELLPFPVESYRNTLSSLEAWTPELQFSSTHYWNIWSLRISCGPEMETKRSWNVLKSRILYSFICCDFLFLIMISAVNRRSVSNEEVWGSIQCLGRTVKHSIICVIKMEKHHKLWHFSRHTSLSSSSSSSFSAAGLLQKLLTGGSCSTNPL